MLGGASAATGVRLRTTRFFNAQHARCAAEGDWAAGTGSQVDVRKFEARQGSLLRFCAVQLSCSGHTGPGFGLADKPLRCRAPPRGSYRQDRPLQLHDRSGPRRAALGVFCEAAWLGDTRASSPGSAPKFAGPGTETTRTEAGRRSGQEVNRSTEMEEFITVSRKECYA